MTTDTKLPPAAITVPLDCLSRRGRLYVTHLAHRRPPLARIVMAIEQHAARADGISTFLAIDDFVAERLVAVRGAQLPSLQVAAACRDYVLARGHDWPGEKPALAHLRQVLGEQWGVSKCHNLGERESTNGWRGVALVAA